MDKDQRLIAAGWLFAVGSAVHIADHLRRGQDAIAETLYRVGTLGIVLQVAVVTLILTRHRLAPLAAVSIGFPLAIGFFAAHWLPHWSSLSDPVWRIDSMPALSGVASIVEIIGALAVGCAGLAVVRGRGIASFAPA
jgi:hypothetical protein